MKNNTAAPRRFRFNFIDVLLILIILAAAVLLAYIFTSSEITLFDSQQTVEIEYTVLLRNVREEFRDLIEAGDHVTDTVTLYGIGEVTDVSYADGSYTGINHSAATVVNGPYPEHMNVTITIRAQASVGDGFYDIGGYKVAVGKLIDLRVPHFTGEGYCRTITEVSTNG